MTTAFAPMVGTRITATCTFETNAGVLSDPGTIVVTVQRPDGTTFTLVASQSATGVWEVSWEPDQPGRWLVQFEGSISGPIATDCAAFLVSPLCIS